MKKVIWGLMIWMIFGVGAKQIEAMDVYVATNGDNNNSGLTIDKPLKDLKAAQAKVRGLLPNMSENIYVKIRGGKYELTEPLVLNSDDSGRNGFKVVWMNHNNEEVVISGGKTVSGWTTEGNLLKANIGTGLKFRTFFCEWRKSGTG